MDSFLKQILNFHQSPVTAKLRDCIRQKSLLEIWKAGNQENGHSNFLAWLLAPQESHDLGDFALQKLLLLLSICNKTQEQQLPEELIRTLLSGENIIRSAKVERELDIKENGRVDIVVTMELTRELAGMQRLLIVLENKINANETNAQTIRYYQHFCKREEGKSHLVFVYLTPAHAQPCQDPHFIHIYYQQILDTILSPALQSPNIPEHTRILLSEYVRLLSSFNTDSLFIAMNKQQRNLLIQFWEENSALMLACAQALSEDPGVDPDIQESARDFVEQVKKANQRDCTKYICCDSEGQYSEPMRKGRMVLYIVKSYTEKENCTYAQLKDVFAPGWFNEVKNVDMAAKPKRYFLSDEDLINLSSGERIAVSNQCGGAGALINFEIFIKKAKNLGFIIEQEPCA